MKKNKALEEIKKFNKGRIENLLQLKYKNMRKDVFMFYRGTAHLFYQNISNHSFLYNCPKSWICGDLHFENFGSFKGDNGLVYFDINDFDEAVLAPCLFDLGRFLVSLRLITELSTMKSKEADELCQLFLDVYCKTLLTGNSRSVEKETAKGLVKKLLVRVCKRKPIVQLYSEKKGKDRQLDFDHADLVKPSKEEKMIIKQLINQWNKVQNKKSSYHVADIGYHLKGISSLGLNRYILMVQKKSNKKFKLIDLKLATPSCVTTTHTRQPKWENEAKRTIEIQKRVQGTSQALLHSIALKNNSYVLREYQSYEDKINYHLLNGKMNKFQPVVTTMAEVTAWGQLQSSGRGGSAITDELIVFAKEQKKWQRKLLDFTKKTVTAVKRDYDIFCQAYDENHFK